MLSYPLVFILSEVFLLNGKSAPTKSYKATPNLRRSSYTVCLEAPQFFYLRRDKDTVCCALVLKDFCSFIVFLKENFFW